MAPSKLAIASLLLLGAPAAAFVAPGHGAAAAGPQVPRHDVAVLGELPAFEEPAPQPQAGPLGL
eukprot:CAMPEP_0115710964 /NCGR_PEP_ID=MMETSP0272-20121206/73309_1 /TAXON_ID=71861 /ORGANISM="Scrippsiella trochoidea, Strain CCMP3099" /LENGTH=63 /DNA_ID=CAMNT_0003152723 /DNA_START=75 /DNA_END=262 /DNA_ORIENTATION=+